MATSQLNRVVQILRRGALLRDGAGLTDGQLLECFIARREDAAFEALVRRHGPMVWGVCRRILGAHHDAEDAFQAIFLVLLRKAASVEPREMLANWLYGVAHHTALKARAKAIRTRTRERQVAVMPEPAVEPKLWENLQPLLDQELSRLPEKYRVPIILCDLEGKTHKQAARQLGCPEGTLSARLSRGRVLLANRLARHGLPCSGAALAVVLTQNTASAGMPMSVVSGTVKAVATVTAGQLAVGSVISSKAGVLAEGVVKAMLLTKLKFPAAVLLTLGAITCGLGWLQSAVATHHGNDLHAPNAIPPRAMVAFQDAQAGAGKKKDEERFVGTWRILKNPVDAKVTNELRKQLVELKVELELSTPEPQMPGAGNAVISMLRRHIELQRTVMGKAALLECASAFQFDVVAAWRLTFSKDFKTKLTGPAKSKSKEGHYKLPGVGQVDLAIGGGQNSNPGIFKFDGDNKLTICLGINSADGKRPTEFRSSENQIILDLERAKPGEESPTVNERQAYMEFQFLEEKAKRDREKAAREAGEQALSQDDAHQQSAGNLAKIGKAMQAYHAKNKSFPPQAICAKDLETPLLSWRVAILPFLGEVELYKEFKLDEAWDSEHNKKLIAKMPKVYGPANPEIEGEGLTWFQVFTGLRTVFHGGTTGFRLTSILDGPAKTILAIEAKTPVAWTKPADLIVAGPEKAELALAIADAELASAKLFKNNALRDLNMMEELLNNGTATKDEQASSRARLEGARVKLAKGEAELITKSLALQIRAAELSQVKDAVKELEARIQAAQSDLGDWKERANWSSRMYKKGLMSKEQADADAARVEPFRLELEKLKQQRWPLLGVPPVGGLFKDGLHILFCDGTVRFVRHENLDPVLLRALITPNGGEPVDLDKLK